MKRQLAPGVVFVLFFPAILAPLLFLPIILGRLLSRSHGHGYNHQSVAPWDFPDEPNPNKIANPGPPLPEPKNVVHVKDNAVTEPDGFSIQLDHVSKGNSPNWLHWWTPQGGPITKKPENALAEADQPPLKVGRQRELDFKLVITGSDPIDYIGYVPDGARSGLTLLEQNNHGWDSTTRIMPFSIRQEIKPLVTVDDPEASRFMFGVARGKWSSVVTVNNTLGKAEPDGQIIAEGAWGTARYAKKNPPVGQTRRFNATIIELTAPSEPVDMDLRIRSFDEDGAEVPIMNIRGVGFIPSWDGRFAKPVKTFTIEQRPYTYYEFDGIHYDPDPSQWRDFVWGPNPPTEKVEIGGVTVELLAVSHTELVTDSTGSNYRTDKVYTVNNKIWKDAPDPWDVASSPESQFMGRFNPKTNGFDPPEKFPRPMIADFKYDVPAIQAADSPVANFAVFGSNSDQPGQDLRADWGKANILYSTDLSMKPLNEWTMIPFYLAPEEKFVQFRFEIASGPWQKLGEVKPNPRDFVVPPNAGFSRPTLVIGPQISMRTVGPDGHYRSRVLSHIKVDGMNTRVVARMKDGSRKTLRVTSYDDFGTGAYWPGYDFKKDPSDSNQVGVDPDQVVYFEVEGQTIKTGYLVYKPPVDR